MAKAVRIRIRSGNEEHTSLESLKHNFNIEDIEPLLLDGRLERWLRQKHENAIADSISIISEEFKDKDIDSVYELLNVFFPGILHDIDKLAECWSNSIEYKKNGEYLYQYLVRHGDSKAAIYLYNNNVLPSDINIFSLLSESQGANDKSGNVEYILGICYFEGNGVNKDIEKGNELINKAFDKNQPQAKLFVKERRYEKEKEKSIRSSLNTVNDKMKQWCQRFGNWTVDDYLREKNGIFDEEEKVLIDFLVKCTFIINANLDKESPRKYLEKYLDNGPFSNVAQFIEALTVYEAYGYCRNYETRLKDLDSSYEPAAYLLAKHIYKNSRRIKWKKLDDARFDEINPLEQMIYVINNFFDFQ